ncbi:MAG: sirohydrochlorin chelatase, partial [Nitrospinota bacterium]
LAHLEITAPSLMDVATEAMENGVRSIRLLPLFMAGGGHVAFDIPKLAEEAMARFPELQIEVLPAIGEHPRVVELIYEIALDEAQ